MKLPWCQITEARLLSLADWQEFQHRPFEREFTVVTASMSLSVFGNGRRPCPANQRSTCKPGKRRGVLSGF
jgi:hypothetical protein